uniref:NAD(P)-binding protein n=1 Tax=Rhabditophanes sp. KR3021 TaxID=114890 RepID=A0AC35UIJ4_9BILA
MPKTSKRIILITGCLSGVGKQAAISLLNNRQNNFVIFHGDTKEHCEKLITAISELHENPITESIDYVAADFSDLKEVVRMAEEIKIRFPNLNHLICCENVMSQRQIITKNSLELTFQVNHLAHFYLISQLLPILKQNAPSQIIVAGSSLHSISGLDLDDVLCEKTYDKYMQFSRTMLMNQMMVLALFHRMNEAGDETINVNIVDASPILEKNSCNRNGRLSLSNSTLVIDSKENKSIGELLECGTFDHFSGRFFDMHGRQIQSSVQASDVRNQKVFWDFSERMCDNVFNKVLSE